MTNQLIEYIRLHITSLEQDVEKLNSNKSNIWAEGAELEEVYLLGQIHSSQHLLSVVHDILGETNNEGEE